MISEIKKPNKVAVPLEVGLKWWQDGFIYQQSLRAIASSFFKKLLSNEKFKTKKLKIL